MGCQRGEAGPTNQSPWGLEFGDAFARGGQLLLQFGDACLQLPDHILSAAVLSLADTPAVRCLGFFTRVAAVNLRQSRTGLLRLRRSALPSLTPSPPSRTSPGSRKTTPPAESLLGRADCSGNRWVPQTTCADGKFRRSSSA